MLVSGIETHMNFSCSHFLFSIMSTSLESTNALRSRATEVALTNAEASALIANGVSSLARLAFAACAPGQTPTDEQLAALIGPVPLNAGNAASLKRLIFEAQTLICSEVKNKAGKREDSSHVTFAGPERGARILQQRVRLTGLRFRGEEECSYASYDLVLSVLEKDCLTYLGPEKFPTRRSELLQKKPNKEITIDQSQLIVKEKQAELTCPTITELEVSNAFKRRALAFDLAGAITYDVMAACHADLLDHLHLPSPPGYSPVSVQQVLRADRAAFLYLSERLTTLKRNAAGELPLDLLLPTVLIQPTVAFHLLPLSGPTGKSSSSNKSTVSERKRSRTPTRPQPKNKGKGKGKSKKGIRGPNVPSALIGKALETPQKKRLCWAFNLPNGCSAAKPGETCSKGLHVCAEPGCFKHHSLQDHR